MSAAPLRTGSTPWLALAAVCLLGLFLRLTGVGRLLPQWHEPDLFSLSQMQKFQHDPTAAWEGGFEERYPTLLSRTLALLPLGEVPARVHPGEDPLAVHLAGASRPFLRMRVAVALLGALLVPLTWFVARRFVRSSTALLAAFFVAISLLHVFCSQQARPHAAHATMDWFVLALALCVVERGSWAFIAAAGIAAGLAIACLQPGVFVLPPLCLALWMMPRPRRVRIACIALVPIAAAGFASLFYARLPYVDAEGLHLAGEGSHVIARENVTGSGLLQCVALLRAHDPALTVLAGLGVLVAIGLLATRTSEVTAGGRRALWIVAAYALPYAAVISIDSEVYERFLLPLVPCIACLAAAAVMWIAGRAAALASALARRAGARTTPSSAARLDRALRASAIAIVIVAAIAQPGYADLRYVLAATAPDTYQQTAAWLEREPGAHSARILVSSSLVLPVFWSERALRVHAAAERKASMPWLVYQSFVPADERRPSFDMYSFPVDLMLREEPDLPALKRYVDELAPDYVILEDIPRANNWPMLRLLRKWTVVEGTVEFESHGESPDVETLGPLDFQDVVELAARIVHTRAFGPKIAVFRIRH